MDVASCHAGRGATAGPGNDDGEEPQISVFALAQRMQLRRTERGVP
jgi:hypothetical protein